MSQAASHPNTRAKNATTHPGQPVLDMKQKRRTKQAKEADDKNLQAALEAKEAAAVVGLNRLAAMQVDMEKAQAQETAKKPVAVKPRAQPKKVQEPSPVSSKLHEPLEQQNDRSRGL